MIVIDKNGEVLNWINSYNDSKLGCKRLDLATFEASQGLQEELILINIDILESCSEEIFKKLERARGLLIYSNVLTTVNKIPTNFLSQVGPYSNKELLVLQINNIESLLKDNNLLKSQMISMSMELTDLMDGVEGQLIRVKHAYEKVAPKRLEEFQGFKIFSKYAAGESMGGEFFDLFAKDDKLFIMMSNSSSYLGSSAILQLFSEFKAKDSISEEEEINFINAVKGQIESLSDSKKKKVSAQLLTCVLDIKRMKARGHLLGNFRIVSSDLEHSFESENSIEMDLEVASFERTIARGERLMFCSPGFVMNWQSMTPKFLIEEIMTDKKIKVLDILDEVFYQLKRDASGNFLKSDASAIILEVEQNVMLQV